MSYFDSPDNPEPLWFDSEIWWYEFRRAMREDMDAQSRRYSK